MSMECSRISHFKSLITPFAPDSSCSVTTNHTHLVFKDFPLSNLKMIATFRSQLPLIVCEGAPATVQSVSFRRNAFVDVISWCKRGISSEVLMKQQWLRRLSVLMQPAVWGCKTMRRSGEPREKGLEKQEAVGVGGCAVASAVVHVVSSYTWLKHQDASSSCDFNQYCLQSRK